VTKLESILNDALALPANERGRLIQRLIESLDDGQDETDSEDAWAEVIARRIADLDAGRAKVVDAKAAIAAARQALAERRRRHG
jgi:putative addiction module component (TIGR02574 family)